MAAIAEARAPTLRICTRVVPLPIEVQFCFMQSFVPSGMQLHVWHPSVLFQTKPPCSFTHWSIDVTLVVVEGVQLRAVQPTAPSGKQLHTLQSRFQLCLPPFCWTHFSKALGPVGGGVQCIAVQTTLPWEVHWHVLQSRFQISWPPFFWTHTSNGVDGVTGQCVVAHNTLPSGVHWHSLQPCLKNCPPLFLTHWSNVRKRLRLNQHEMRWKNQGKQFQCKIKGRKTIFFSELSH